MLEVATAAVVAAVMVIFCSLPGDKLKDAGDAVTLVGKPKAVTETDEEKPLMADSEMVQVVLAPAASDRLAGVVDRVKSLAVGEVEPDPPEPQPEAKIRMRLRAASCDKLTTRSKLVELIRKLLRFSKILSS